MTMKDVEHFTSECTFRELLKMMLLVIAELLCRYDDEILRSGRSAG